MKRLGIYLDDETHKKLKVLAAEKGKSMNEMAVVLLMKLIKQKG